MLPLAELPLRVLSPLRAVPVLLPSPERVASPAADPPDALPLADPVAEPLVDPAVEPLVVSAASDAAPFPFTGVSRLADAVARIGEDRWR